MKYLSLLGLLAFHLSLFGQGEWEKTKEEDGITVYFRDAAHSNIKEVLIELDIETTLSALMAALHDIDSYTEWVYKMPEAREVLHSGDDHEVYYYSRSDFPWPLSDRDMVVRSTFRQDPITKVITSRSVAVPDALPRETDLVRIEHMDITWTISPKEEGGVHIEYRFASDPGGALPAWLINLALDKGPMGTFRGLRQELTKRKYRYVTVPGVREPEVATAIGGK